MKPGYGLINGLKNYIVKTRWWPWRNTWREISIVYYEEVSDLIYIVFKANNKLFQLPLLRVNNIPNGLESRSFCVESNCFIEAEYSPDYINYFTKLEGQNTETYGELLFKIHSAKPLSLETTNVTVVYCTSIGEIVLKSYRLVPLVNTEYLILKKLVEYNYTNIPRIIAFLKYSNFVTGILMHYVKGIGDGGKPFYESFINKIRGYETLNLEQKLGSKLGSIISNMHIALNYGIKDSFYGVEEISERDIEYWIKRCEKYYNESFKQITSFIEKQNSENRVKFEYWRDLFSKMHNSIFDNLIDLMNKQRDLFKGRIHQDLHLAQMIYVEEKNDFIITDFEGEPGRSSDERLLKEPLIRDLASMIRSFQYLVHSAISSIYRKDIHNTSIYMLRNDPSIHWRRSIYESMVENYLSSIVGLKLLSPYEESVVKNYWLYIKPWLIERALYEIYYESMYRPLWISIPITGLYQVLYIGI